MQLVKERCEFIIHRSNWFGDDFCLSRIRNKLIGRAMWRVLASHHDGQCKNDVEQNSHRTPGNLLRLTARPAYNPWWSRSPNRRSQTLLEAHNLNPNH